MRSILRWGRLATHVMCIILPVGGRLQKAAGFSGRCLEDCVSVSIPERLFHLPCAFKPPSQFQSHSCVEPGDQWEVRILAPTKDKTRQDDKRKNCRVTKLKGRQVDLGKQGSLVREAVICLQDCGGSCQAEATEMHHREEKARLVFRGHHDSHFYLREKKKTLGSKMSRSVRATEQWKQMLQLYNTERDALSVCPKCSLSNRALGPTRHPSHSHLKGVLLRMA